MPPQADLAHALTQLNALYNHGQFNEAQEAASALLQRYPEAGPAWKLLGMLQRRVGVSALAALERASHYLPNDFEVWNSLGNARRDSADPLHAEEAYRRAVTLKSDFALAYSNLGLVLCDLGRPSEAEAQCRRALSIQPDLVMALNNLGMALRDQGKLGEALASYRQAAAIQPNVAELHHNIGNVLQEYGRYEEALACYRQATALHSGYLSAYVNMARIWKQQHRPADAKALCAKVLAADPAYGPALVLEAELYADAGQFDAAESSLRLVAVSSLSFPEAWAGIPALRKMAPADADWLARAQELAAKHLPTRWGSQLHFAMGKYFDDVGDYDQAFAHYRRAHALASSFGIPYQREAQQPAVDVLLRAWSRDWITARRPGANLSAKPVFVVGMPRSGTSLVEQILASHPDAFGAGELDFWKDESPRLLASSEPVGDEALCDVAQRYLGLLGQFAPSAQRVVDKMPGNFLYLGLIHAAFPNARIIHMQRDPADTCLSIYFQRFDISHPYANDLQDLAHAYRTYRYAMAQWTNLLPPHAILHLPYEELVADQEGWTRKLLDFVGLPWDPRCLEFHKQERSVGTASNWQVRQKMSNTSVARWRRYEQYIAPLLALREETG